MSENNENLDELESQLREQLEKIRLKKLEIERVKREEEERKWKEEQERLRREEEERKNSPVIILVHGVVDFTKVHFTIENLREDVRKWIVYTYSVNKDYKHSTLPNSFTTDVTAWDVVISNLSKLNNISFSYENDSLTQIEEAKNAPHFKVDAHPDGLKVFIHPNADYYAASHIQSIPGAKPVAGTHNKEWIVPYIYSFMLIQKLNERKVKFTKEADERIKADFAMRDELDRIAKLDDTDEIKIDWKNGIIPRGFQNVGILFGMKRFAATKGKRGGFIIADEMGLGKTLQAMGVGAEFSRFLVICPAGLKENWYRELLKMLNIEAVVLSGAIPDITDIMTLMVKKPRAVIINYDLVGKAVEIKGEVKVIDGEKKKLPDIVKWPWVEALNGAGFDIVIYDEAHKLKNRDSKRSQASRLITIPHVICVTGTPITNRPQEYWPLLKLVAPDDIPNSEQFEARYVSVDGKRAANIDELRHLVKPFMIRRTKKEVVADLPPIIRTTNFHTLSEPSLKLYKKAEEGLYQTIRAFDPRREGEDQLINSVLTQILRMKQICAHDKIESTVDLAVSVLDSYEEGEINNKVIIFTQFVDLVREIQKRLSGDFITVAFTGEDSMRERYDRCDRFQNDPNVRALVTTMKVASEGLTLTRAGGVIFNDFGWTPAEHEQAEARCYGRLNDMHGARSYYNAAANTIEDWIQELLLIKMGVINAVVDGVAIARDEDTSILKEIIRRIKEG